MSRVAVCLIFIAILHNGILKVAQADETTTESVTKTNEEEEEITSPTVTSTPVVTTPVVTTPDESTPVTSTPDLSTPVATTPSATTPVVTTPVMSAPVKSTRVMSAPVMSTPDMSVPVTSTPNMSTPDISTPDISTPIVLPTATVAKGEEEIGLIGKSGATIEELAKTKLKEVVEDVVKKTSAISNQEEDLRVSGVTIKENLGDFQTSVSLINGIPVKASRSFFELPQKTILQPISAAHESVQNAIAKSIDSAKNMASGTFTFFKEMNTNFGVPRWR